MKPTIVKDKNKEDLPKDEVVLDGSDSSGMGDADMDVEDIETRDHSTKTSEV